MRCLCSMVAIAVSILISPLWGAARLLPANVKVGKGLEVSTGITLSEPAPDDGLEITVTSDDPSRLLFAKLPDAKGTVSITLSVRPGFLSTPEFWVQGLRDDGSVTYTASAPGYTNSKGTVTLSPSGVIIAGPMGSPSFPTTPRADPSRITIYSVMLDSDLKYLAQQAVAGGIPVEVSVSSSNTGVGTITPSPATIAPGTGSVALEFQPVGKGATTLSASVPKGWSAPAESTTVKAIVNLPGLSVTDQVRIGRDLQVGGLVGLGEVAPEGGVTVNLTSDSPALLISATATDVGSKSITLTILAGEAKATYYLQAVGDSGSVTYTADASGYRSRTGAVTLTPSGVVVMPKPYGPPDEAEVLRKEGGGGSAGMFASLSGHSTMPLLLWTEQLDPTTRRGADITVQPLRAGVSLTVDLKSSDPKVGNVTSPVTIAAGSDNGSTEFMAARVGSTVISAVTPAGFTTPSNNTSLSIIVRE